jgi:diphosphomevalonate decarboxylase
MLGARSIAPRDALDVRVLVCVVSEARKLRSSREGMLLTMARSPFYAPWLELAPRLFTEMKAALAGRDAPKLFDLAEQSSLAMHASAMAAGVVYVRDVTLDLYACVRDMRARGLATFATSDAGPHVKVFVPTNEAKTAHAQLRDVPGVLRVIESSVGEGARVP